MSQSKTSRGLSFKFKLIGLCIFMASVSGVIGAISYKGLNDTAAVSLTITDEVMPKLAHVNEMFVNFRHIRIELRTLALPGISTAQAKLATQGTLDTIAAYEKAMALYEKEGFEPGQRELYDNVAANWKAFKAIGQRVLELEKSGTPEDRKNMVAIFFEDCPKTAQNYTVAMTKLLEFHKTVASNRAAQSKATASRTDSLVLMVLFLGVAAGLSVGIVFSTRVSNSISIVTEALARSVENVTSTSTEIASSSNKLASASSQQASSLQQTAASLEEISAMIAKASESAGATASSSTESQNKAESGRKTVGEMLGSIHDISQSNDAIMIEVNKSNAQMTEIVSVIHGIGEKTKVINDIVFQTKLLSFNASVEAARAGEHGKGFAVVAEEVGKLAQMSGNAAKEISEMLESSVRTVEKIAQDTKTKVEALIAQGKLKVDSGVTVARECSGILENIVDNVTVVSALALEISQATKEQALGVSEINKAMGQLDAVTNQNAALSEEAATSAKHLSIEAVALREAVTQLVTLVHGREPASERTNLHRVEVEATSEHHLRAA